MEPFAFANSTSCWSWSLVAALPVGLFGQQKNMTSVFRVIDKFGKKLFSGLHFMYTMLPYLPVSSSNFPARPKMTLESMYAWSKQEGSRKFNGLLKSHDNLRMAKSSGLNSINECSKTVICWFVFCFVKTYKPLILHKKMPHILIDRIGIWINCGLNLCTIYFISRPKTLFILLIRI